MENHQTNLIQIQQQLNRVQWSLKLSIQTPKEKYLLKELVKCEDFKRKLSKINKV